MKTIENIMGPERHDPISGHQVGPRQHVEWEDNVDRVQLVRDMIVTHPDLSADDVTRMLRDRHIDVSSTLVLQELQRQWRASGVKH